MKLKLYKMTITPASMSYIVMAEDEKKAKEYAMDNFFDEKLHSIFEGSKVLMEVLNDETLS